MSSGQRLEPLLGEWEMHASIEGNPVGGQARTVFEWAEDGAFLRQHADGWTDESTPKEWRENSPLPVTALIGLDDTNETYYQLYADARGVFRVYQMAFEDGTWKLWRNAPGFCQRFTGTFSDDGNTINGRWDSSPDGSAWEPDFELTYTRLD